MGRATWGFPGFGIRGRVGGLEFVAARDGGTIVREIPTVRAVRTPAQRESEARLKAVGAAWANLSDAEREAWERWAQSPHRSPSPRGGDTPMQPYNAFSGLAAKCLQMRPGEAVPSLPPATAFLGDGIVVSVSGSLPLGRGRGGVEGPVGEPEYGEGRGPPTLPSPKGEGSPAVVFSASGPNSAGVVTELLMQPLARASRKARAKEYRSRRFVAFEGDSPSVELPCEAGAWACAVRFVRWDTGQETAVVPIGKVVVAG